MIPTTKVGEVFLLGSPQVDNCTLPIQSKKPIRLVALLALHTNQPVNYATVAKELQDPTRSDNATQVLVTLVRKLGIGISWLGNGYTLELDSTQVDVLRFIGRVGDGTRLLARGSIAPAYTALSAARRLAERGAFLQGVALGPVLRSWSKDVTASQLALAIGLHRIALLRGEAEASLTMMIEDWRKKPASEELAMLLALALFRTGKAALVPRLLETTVRRLARSNHHPSKLVDLTRRIAQNDLELLEIDKIPF